jgi:hypothetical protein
MLPTDQALVIWATGNCVAKVADLLCTTAAKATPHLDGIADELDAARKSITMLNFILAEARK